MKKYVMSFMTADKTIIETDETQEELLKRMMEEYPSLVIMELREATQADTGIMEESPSKLLH
jgi:hypothetical protein